MIAPAGAHCQRVRRRSCGIRGTPRYSDIPGSRVHDGDPGRRLGGHTTLTTISWPASSGAFIAVPVTRCSRAQSDATSIRSRCAAGVQHQDRIVTPPGRYGILACCSVATIRPTLRPPIWLSFGEVVQLIHLAPGRTTSNSCGPSARGRSQQQRRAGRRSRRKRAAALMRQTPVWSARIATPATLAQRWRHSSGICSGPRWTSPPQDAFDTADRSCRVCLSSAMA